jgi:ketosteroid isomerase-like protein
VQVFSDDGAADGLLAAAAPFFHDDVRVGQGSGFQADWSGVGLADLRDGWKDWLEPWESYRTEVEDVFEAGDRIVVLVRDFGRRSGTTAEVSVAGGSVWKVRDGKVAEVEFYIDRADAWRRWGSADRDVLDLDRLLAALVEALEVPVGRSPGPGAGSRG